MKQDIRGLQQLEAPLPVKSLWCSYLASLAVPQTAA